MAPKKPKTFADRARAISEHQRFQLNQARELIDEMEDGANAAQEYVDLDPMSALDTLDQVAEMFDSLSSYSTPVISAENQTHFSELLAELKELMPETDDVAAVHDTWEEARDSVDELESMREDPSNYSAEERESNRDTAREKFDALAEALAAKGQ